MLDPLIHVHIWDPTQSIFKVPKNERAECMTITCTLDNCALRAKGQCMLVGAFPTRCPYGKRSTQHGPTQRSRTFRKWIDDHKTQFSYIPKLLLPSKILCFVGDYVYLPYAYLEVFGTKAVDELMPGSSASLLPRKHWTVQIVLTLLDHRPYALIGGEIKVYQEKEVPLFLTHLREVDPQMWSCIIQVRPHLDRPSSHIGRRAKLVSLTPPVTWTASNVTWTWDGTHAISTAPGGFGSMFGGFHAESHRIEVVPSADAEIEIKDNAWVNPNTVFTT